MGLLAVTDAILDRPIAELASLPTSWDTRAALCGGANRFRDIYDALLLRKRRLARASQRRCPPRPVESFLPDCSTAATARAASLAAA
jgi:hypothetical protein